MFEETFLKMFYVSVLEAAAFFFSRALFLSPNVKKSLVLIPISLDVLL